MTHAEWGVVAASLAAIAWVNWYFFVAGRVPVVATVAARPVGPAGATGAVPEVVITVDGGYSPNAVSVKAGERVRLVFDRKDDASCSDEVVFPDFNIRKYLPSGERTTIELTPPKAGRYTFTCGMSMLRGTVVADD